MRNLRPHQSQAIARLRTSLASGNRRPMLCLPTGAGKTLTAAKIIENAQAKGKRVAFVVPALALIEQTIKAFWDEGVRDIGVLQGNHAMTRRGAAIQVCSSQTLARRMEPDVDLVIVDEAHVMSKAITDWMASQPKLPFIGLSATPWTRGLGKHYDDLIQPVTMAELIGLNFLTPFRVFAPSHPDLSKARTQAGDYRDDDAVEAMHPLTGDVVQTWIEKAEGRPTLCFGVDRAHAKHLAERFQAAGVPTAYVDGDSDKATRAEIEDQFRNGQVKVVCNVGVLTTGVDWDVRCIVLARPTKSEMLYCQMIGRGLRTAPGKDDCLILDHSDTTLRLGLVTDLGRDALDDGKPRTAEDRADAEEARQERAPAACANCTAVKPKGMRKCPACGWEPQTKGEGLEVAEGELVEMNSRRLKRPTPETKRAFYAELRGYAQQHGKSESFVLANFRERFKEWPARKDAVPAEPTPETLGWLHSRRIAFAKAKGRAA